MATYTPQPEPFTHLNSRRITLPFVIAIKNNNPLANNLMIFMVHSFKVFLLKTTDHASDVRALEDEEYE
jgi:hypothetical protein